MNQPPNGAGSPASTPQADSTKEKTFQICAAWISLPKGGTAICGMAVTSGRVDFPVRKIRHEDSI